MACIHPISWGEFIDVTFHLAYSISAVILVSSLFTLGLGLVTSTSPPPHLYLLWHSSILQLNFWSSGPWAQIASASVCHVSVKIARLALESSKSLVIISCLFLIDWTLHSIKVKFLLVTLRPKVFSVFISIRFDLRTSLSFPVVHLFDWPGLVDLLCRCNFLMMWHVCPFKILYLSSWSTLHLICLSSVNVYLIGWLLCTQTVLFMPFVVGWFLHFIVIWTRLFWSFLLLIPKSNRIQNI